MIRKVRFSAHSGLTATGDAQRFAAMIWSPNATPVPAEPRQAASPGEKQNCPRPSPFLIITQEAQAMSCPGRSAPRCSHLCLTGSLGSHQPGHHFPEATANSSTSQSLTHTNLPSEKIKKVLNNTRGSPPRLHLSS